MFDLVLENGNLIAIPIIIQPKYLPGYFVNHKVGTCTHRELELLLCLPKGQIV